MSTSMRLHVVAGQRRQLVGLIEPQVGMLTSAGRIVRISSKTILFDDGVRRRNLENVTVRHTEARRFGYPNSKGSQRFVVRHIRRGPTTIAA